MTQAQIEYDIAFWKERLSAVTKDTSKAVISAKIEQLERQLAVMKG